MNTEKKSKLYYHLLNFSRINGRNVLHMPKWAQINREDVLKLRSSKQLKRALEKPIFAPIMFEDNKRYRGREIGWDNKGFQKINTPKHLKLYGPEESIAYTKYILPGRYSQNRRVLDELSRLRPTWSPKNIIDFGCGPGTAAQATFCRAACPQRRAHRPPSGRPCAPASRATRRRRAPSTR